MMGDTAYAGNYTSIQQLSCYTWKMQGEFIHSSEIVWKMEIVNDNDDKIYMSNFTSPSLKIFTSIFRQLS